MSIFKRRYSNEDIYHISPVNAWDTIRDKMKIGQSINLLNSDR